MRLDDRQLQLFAAQGYLVIPELFSEQEVELLRDECGALFNQEHPANFRERESGVVRTAMDIHNRSEVFSLLTRHPRLVEPAIQILADDALYAQQVKVNAKVAFSGEIWQWHYDFATHHNEDGVPEPLALNLHVFLDDVTEFNGPLWFIPSSHKYGPARAALDTETTSYPLWCVDRDVVTDLIDEGGLVSVTGKPGTALIFGDCLVHGSPANMSPFNRRIFSVILNPISNAYTKEQRPDYQHHRNLTPIVPLADDCLLRAT
jgi:ectoine hydroxylase